MGIGRGEHYFAYHSCPQGARGPLRETKISVGFAMGAQKWGHLTQLGWEWEIRESILEEMRADLDLAERGVSLVGMEVEGIPGGRNSMCKVLEARAGTCVS